MANVHTVNHNKSENIKSHLSNEDGGMGVQKEGEMPPSSQLILCGGGEGGDGGSSAQGLAGGEKILVWGGLEGREV